MIKMRENIGSIIKNSRQFFHYYTTGLLIVLTIVSITLYNHILNQKSKCGPEENWLMDIQIKTDLIWTAALLSGTYFSANKFSFALEKSFFTIYTIVTLCLFFAKCYFQYYSCAIYNEKNEHCVYFINKDFAFMGTIWDLVLLGVSIFYAGRILTEKNLTKVQ